MRADGTDIRQLTDNQWEEVSWGGRRLVAAKPMKPELSVAKLHERNIATQTTND